MVVQGEMRQAQRGVPLQLLRPRGGGWECFQGEEGCDLGLNGRRGGYGKMVQ